MPEPLRHDTRAPVPSSPTLSSPPPDRSRPAPGLRPRAGVAWLLSLGTVAAALLTALATVPARATVPTQATMPASPCLAEFAASSAADLVTLRTLDLRPLGATGSPVTNALIGSSRAGLYGGPDPLTAARAGILQTLADQRNIAYQIAPPTSAQATTRRLGPIDNGLLHIGTRSLMARATLRDAMVCDAATGPTADASSTLLDDSVLAGQDGQALAAVAGGSASATSTGLMSSGGRYTVTAAATSTLTDLRLFDGSPAATAIQVASQPALLITASGAVESSTVQYLAPSLSVSAGGRTASLAAAGDRLDLVVPADSASTTAATELARDLDAPLLTGTALAGLLTAFTGDPEKPTDRGSSDGVSRVVLIRFSLGTVSKLNAGSLVHAVVSALRLQVLLRTAGADGTTETPLVDMSVGCLEALALAPEQGYVRPTGNPAPPAATGRSDAPPMGGVRSHAARPTDSAGNDVLLDPLDEQDRAASDWAVGGVVAGALGANTEDDPGKVDADQEWWTEPGSTTSHRADGRDGRGTGANGATGVTGGTGPNGYLIGAVFLVGVALLVTARQIAVTRRRRIRVRVPARPTRRP